MADETDKIENMDDIINHLIVKPAKEQQVEEDDAIEQPEVKDQEQVLQPKEEKQQEEVLVEESAEEPVDDDEPIDVDAIELEVTVDGEVRKVPIAELKKRYSAEGAIDKRLQEVTEGRNYVNQQSNELNQVLAYSVARLQALDQLLEQSQQTDVDLETIRKTDPTRWLFEKERIREIQARRERVQQEAAQLEYQQEQLAEAAARDYTVAEHRKLSRAFPELIDPKTSRTVKTDLYETARAYSYTPQEVDSVRDHRAILVLRDAMNWRKYMAKQSEVTQKARVEPKPLLKPGVKKSTTASREQREMKALRDKARSSGRPDDVAATLLVRSRGPRN